MIVAFHGCAKSALKDPHEFTTTETCDYCGSVHSYIYSDERSYPKPKPCPICGHTVHLCSVCTLGLDGWCKKKNKKKCEHKK